MNRHTWTIIGATAALLGGILQLVGDTVYALDRVFPGEPGFAFANLVAATWHCFFVAALVALHGRASSMLGGSGRLGLGAAVAGVVLLVAAEVVTQVRGEIPVVMIAASAPLTGLGMLVAGLVLSRRHGHRLTGGAVMVTGAYALAVIVPTSVGSAGVNYFVIAGWGVCWAALGVSMLLTSPIRHPA